MRLNAEDVTCVLGDISIHASRMGCDATDSPKEYAELISIHASRMGCDNLS